VGLTARHLIAAERAIRKTLAAASLEKPTNTMVNLSLISYTEIS
jgi:hypothetical protein